MIAAACLACGCPRQGTTPREPPDRAGASDAQGTELRYRFDDGPLRERARVEITSTGGGVYLDANLELGVTLRPITSAGAIAIAWSIDDVPRIELRGTTASGAEHGESLRAHGSGTWLVDATGLEDYAAGAEHPDNSGRTKVIADELERVAKARAAGSNVAPSAAVLLLQLLPARLALPRLPAQRLRNGATTTSTETSTLAIELEGVALRVPIETTRTFTLQRVDRSGGTALAELAVEVRRYGGVDTEAGPVELEAHDEGTLWFDVDRGMPVRLELSGTESLTAGDLGTDGTHVVEIEFSH